MPDDLYDRDFLSWAEQQAGLLRLLAGGERLNAAPGFLADAAARFTPWMRQRIDLDRLFARARSQAAAGGVGDGGGFAPGCPWALDALIGEAADIDGLLAALR